MVCIQDDGIGTESREGIAGRKVHVLHYDPHFVSTGPGQRDPSSGHCCVPDFRTFFMPGIPGVNNGGVASVLEGGRFGNHYTREIVLPIATTQLRAVCQLNFQELSICDLRKQEHYGGPKEYFFHSRSFNGRQRGTSRFMGNGFANCTETLDGGIPAGKTFPLDKGSSVSVCQWAGATAPSP